VGSHFCLHIHQLDTLELYFSTFDSSKVRRTTSNKNLARVQPKSKIDNGRYQVGPQKPETDGFSWGEISLLIGVKTNPMYNW